jgi:hypothetical protein
MLRWGGFTQSFSGSKCRPYHEGLHNTMKKTKAQRKKVKRQSSGEFRDEILFHKTSTTLA